MCRLLARLAFLCAALTAPLGAQERDTLTTDLTVGPSAGWGGNYYDQVGVAAEFTLGIRPVALRAQTWALSVGVQAPAANAVALVCLDAPDCGRLRGFPTIVHAGLLGGFSNDHARILLGPALFGGGSAGFGGQVQVDVAGGLPRLAFVLAARGSAFARANGETLRLASLGLGVRLR